MAEPEPEVRFSVQHNLKFAERVRTRPNPEPIASKNHQIISNKIPIEATSPILIFISDVPTCQKSFLCLTRYIPSVLSVTVYVGLFPILRACD